MAGRLQTSRTSMCLLGCLIALPGAMTACTGQSGAAGGSSPTAAPEAERTFADPVPSPDAADTSRVQPAQAAPAGGSVELTLTDYTVAPAASSVPAGPVTISVVNSGRVGHNVAVVATQLPADDLPTSGVRLDESDSRIRVVGKTPNLARSQRTTITVDLEPGSYILVCTVPHHYVRERMLAMLSVQA